MKRKKLSDVNKKDKELLNKLTPNIIKEGNSYFFETGKITTHDIVEAVSIFMKDIDKDDPIWQFEIDHMSLESISPERALYWLSGGDKEWLTLCNYNKTWKECKDIYNDEFGYIIYDILNDSSYLYEIRDLIKSRLSLLILYEFALDNGIIN